MGHGTVDERIRQVSVKSEEEPEKDGTVELKGRFAQMQDDKWYELNVDRVDPHIPLQTQQQEAPVDELPAPHVDKAVEKEEQEVLRRPEVVRVELPEGIHARHEKAQQCKAGQKTNENGNRRFDPAKGKAIVSRIFPDDQKKEDRQEKKAKKGVDAIRVDLNECAQIFKAGFYP